MSMDTPARPRKRSAGLVLTSAMASAGLVLSACDGSSSTAQWSAPREPVEAVAYQSLDACKAAKDVSDAECDKAFTAAKADDAAHSPRYADSKTCEDVYGAGQCVPRSAANGGGSFFTPLLAGFVIGQMMDGGGQRYYRGTGLYRERDDGRGGGGYTTGFGGRLDRDYATGRTTIDKSSIDSNSAVRQAPPRIQTRTAVVSRGGFGGGSRSYGG